MFGTFGSRGRFAIEIGAFSENGSRLRYVDIWAAGRWWTCDDNLADVPQFRDSVRDSFDRLCKGEDLSIPFAGVDAAEAHRRLLAADDGSRERFWFPLWGPTTDNVTAHLFRHGDEILMPFEFWRPLHPRQDELGSVFVARLPERELRSILAQTVASLESGTATRE